MTDRESAFAVAAPGLEAIVAEELTNLGITEQQVVDGGVEFGASRRQLYEANLHLRAASRVLVRLARFRALTFAELERRTQRVPWDRFIAARERVVLRVTCRKSRLYHSGAVAERITRDLVARLGTEVVSASADDGYGDPSAEGAQLIVVRLDRDGCTISVDSSGAHLHQRGYRTSVTQAPMRETLAAALLIASGWDRQSPLLDPFCGSGTIPIEAALMAARIAPGKNRLFQFMQWPGYDSEVWSRVQAAALRSEKLDRIPALRGSDRNAAAIRAAIENAERAGVSQFVQFERRDALRIAADASTGWIVSNPPYGVRLGTSAEARRLMTEFGKTLRERFSGWRVGLLVPATLGRFPGIALSPRIRTTNGGLRVQFAVGTVARETEDQRSRRTAR